MSDKPTNCWDAIVSIAPGVIIFLICLGIGGCTYLCGLSGAENAPTKHSSSQSK